MKRNTKPQDRSASTSKDPLSTKDRKRIRSFNDFLKGTILLNDLHWLIKQVFGNKSFRLYCNLLYMHKRNRSPVIFSQDQLDDMVRAYFHLELDRQSMMTLLVTILMDEEAWLYCKHEQMIWEALFIGNIAGEQNLIFN